MKNRQEKFIELKQRAEKLLNPAEVTLVSDSISHSIAEIRRTIHELYSYRIELELQNDELQNTQQQLQEVSQDYLDFYNFAPVAFAALSADGRILKANTTLSTFLGIAKQRLLNQPLTNYVLDIDQDILYFYRQALIDRQKPNACELRLRRNGQNVWVKCEGYLNDEPADNTLNLVFTDITKRKQAEEALQDLFSHQEIALENERSKVEHDIHAALGSNLVGLKVELSALRKQLPAELSNCHEKCAVMSAHLDTLLQATINITNQIRSSTLDHFGLLAAIAEKFKDFRQQTGIQCDLKMPENTLEMDKYHEIMVFRILQEALANIALHAKATQVSLNVDVDANSLMLKLTDNGCGMTDEQMHTHGKYGIFTMRERARNIGAKITLFSQVEKGTWLVLTVPLKPTKS
jgi:PAS domain S-box-containing protein